MINADFSTAYRQVISHLQQRDFVAADSASADLVNRHGQHADAWNLAGIVAAENGRLHDSIAAHQKAISLEDGFAQAWNNLGAVQMRLGRADAAMASFQRALSLNPEDLSAFDNLLLAAHCTSSVSPEGLAAWHFLYGARLATRVLPKRHRIAARPKTQLKIGYVSADFYSHSVAWFLEPLLSHHNKQRFHVTCYAGVARPDETTRRLQRCADSWVDTTALNDECLAQRIVADKIDVLIDLAGHTPSHRLGVFARKPAPVQLTWLGYANTTGLSSIAYRLTDEICDPPSADVLHSETLIRMPNGFHCYQPPNVTLNPNVPSQSGQHITFGSFNDFAKISPECVTAWSAILRNIPTAKLLLKARAFENAAVREEVLLRFAAQRIAADRLTLIGFQKTTDEHLHTYDRIDIALDSFPYCGTTTTCEALWMGVPVITLSGASHVARVGHSLLTRVGLDDLVATSIDEYVAIATQLATTPERLQAIRSGRVHDLMQNSPLCQPKAFAIDFESAIDSIFKHAQDADPLQPEFLEIPNNVHIAVEDTDLSLTAWVLREQRDWFEDEIRFVRKLMRPGDVAIDVGANHGVYALTMAKLVGDAGRIYAFEPASTPRNLLLHSMKRNRFANLEVHGAALSDSQGTSTLFTGQNSELNALKRQDGLHTHSEQVDVTTIDLCAKKYNWHNVAFVKLDAEGEEINIVKGGFDFFTRESPLVMFELKHGAIVNHGLIEAILKHGFTTYRLVPGLNLLEPFDPSIQADDFLLNLFACKVVTGRSLEQRGLLATAVAEVPVPPSIAAFGTVEGRWPFARRWTKERRDDRPAHSVYMKAIELWAQAQDVALSPQVRLGSLHQAFHALSQSVNQHISLARLWTLGRVARDLGLRSTALKCAHHALNLLLQNPTLPLEEPCLLPAPSFEQVDPEARQREWMLACTIHAREELRSFSSYFLAPNDGQKELKALAETGFMRPDMAMRWELVQRRSQAKQ